MRLPGRQLWTSLGFQLALSYGLLVTVILSAALAVVYMQTLGVMHQSVQRQVLAMEQQLMARFAYGGSAALAAEIDRFLTDGLHTDLELYLLIDSQGLPVAGNIAHEGSTQAWVDAARQSTLVRAGRTITAQLIARPLPDGGLLVVGLDLQELLAIEALIGRASATAGIVSFVLILGGAFMLRAELERRIASLRRTAARVRAGELQQRVELQGDEDEFTLLKHDINAMLDRIQVLMDGVRTASDSIAHNLRTPLTRALLHLEAAQDGEMPNAQRHLVIGAAMRDLKDLTATFEKLLQIAEAESGTYRRRFAPVPLHAVADDVVELYDALAESDGARLVREPREQALVNGDRDLLADALATLVDNALKYGGVGATVRVGTFVAGGAVRLTVQDDGPGIASAEYSRIGTRFYRIDRSKPGYGLGLASVRAIVALHGGVLRFQDARPGLRVEVELPLREGTPAA